MFLPSKEVDTKSSARFFACSKLSFCCIMICEASLCSIKSKFTNLHINKKSTNYECFVLWVKCLVILYFCGEDQVSGQIGFWLFGFRAFRNSVRENRG